MPVLGFRSTAGKDGTWTLLAPGIAGANYTMQTLKATGSAGYDPKSAATLQSTWYANIQGFVHRPGRTDASWLSSTPTYPTVPALFAGINL